MIRLTSLLAIIALAACAAAQTGTTKKSTHKASTTAKATAGPSKVTGPGKSLPGGLQYWDIKPGTGPEAKTGDTVKVEYTGWLTNGKKFDSNAGTGQPFTVKLGAGQVIKGWDEGVTGMKVGGKRKLTIPPDLGYGARGAGGVIPPNATLIFDVELLDLR